MHSFVPGKGAAHRDKRLGPAANPSHTGLTPSPAARREGDSRGSKNIGDWSSITGIVNVLAIAVHAWTRALRPHLHACTANADDLYKRYRGQHVYERRNSHGAGGHGLFGLPSLPWSTPQSHPSHVSWHHDVRHDGLFGNGRRGFCPN
jgi:hypothetical protein